MRGKLIVAFLAVLFLLPAIAIAADNIEITAPSSVFIPEGRGSDFRFFVKNKDNTNDVTVYLSLDGYSAAKFWAAPQRSFENLLLEQNDRQLTINGLKAGKAAEFFVRLEAKKGEPPLAMICSNEGCTPAEKTIEVNIGDVPSFSVINIYSIFLILFASLLIFSKLI